MSPKIDMCSVNATATWEQRAPLSVSNCILQLTLPITRRTTIICLLAGRKTCHLRGGNGLSHTIHLPRRSPVHALRLRVRGGGGLGAFCLGFLCKVLGKISLLPGRLPRAGPVHTTL